MGSIIHDAVMAQAAAAGLRVGPDPSSRLKNDAGEAAFFIRSLEDISVTLYNALYPDIKVRSILPFKTDLNPAAEFHVWRGYDKVGQSDETDTYSDDIPEGEVFAGETAQKITGIVDGYGYSIQDIRKAQMAGVPLDTMKAALARETMERKLDVMGAIGSKNRAVNGIYGLFNHPLLPVALDISTQNTGASGATGTPLATSDGTRWDFSPAHGKGVKQIAADLNSARSAIRLGSLGVHDADTVILDLATDTIWEQTPVSIGDASIYQNMSVKAWLKMTCTWIKNFEVWNQASTSAGTLVTQGTAAGKPECMVYEKNPRNYAFLMPQEFEQFPPQLRNWKFSVGCHMRCGGVILRYPKAFQKLTKVQG